MLAEDLKAVGDETPAPAGAGPGGAAVGRLVPRSRCGRSSTRSTAGRFGGAWRRRCSMPSAAAARGFLLALAEEADKSRRRRILELLVVFGPVIAGPPELLGDTRWYVVRNMIVLLQRVGDRSALARGAALRGPSRPARPAGGDQVPARLRPRGARATCWPAPSTTPTPRWRKRR